MNETPDLPSPPPASSPTPALAVLTVAVLVLGVSTIVLWSRDAANSIDPTRIDALERRLNQPVSDPPSPPDLSGITARLDTLDQRLTFETAAVQGRLKALEERPAPPSPATAPPPTPPVTSDAERDIDRDLRARIEALEQRRINDPVAQQTRITALEQKSAAESGTLTARLDAMETASVRDLSGALARIAELERKAQELQRGLATRIETLERRPIPDLTPLQEQLARLDQRPTPDPRTPDRLEALSGRMEGQTARSADADRRIEALTTRLTKVEATAEQVGRIADRANRLARIRQAEDALATGQKLGVLPDAPPALARFADINPPTEVGLRLAFPALERAIRAAARPQVAAQPWSERIWDRLQGLVTIREGDRVVIGDSVAGILARAQLALEAGDLGGAVTALAGLTGDAGKAAETWLSDARALLEARSALAALATRD